MITVATVWQAAVKGIGRILQWFTPAQGCRDKEEGNDPSLFVKIGLITSVFAFFYLTVSIIIGYNVGAELNLVCVALLLAILYFFRISGRFRFSVNLYLGCVFLDVLGCCFYSGGFRSMVFPWFILVPLESVLILDFGLDTMVWTLLACAVVFVFGLAGMLGFQFPFLYDPNFTAFFSMTCVAGLMIILALVTMTFSRNQKETENKLRESEKIFRTLFNNTEVAIFRSSLDGSSVLNANEKFLDLVGKTREDVIGKPSSIYWVDPSRREEIVRILKANGRVVDFEFQVINEKLGMRDCLTSVNLHSEEGFLDGSILDITDRKRAQEELKNYQNHLEDLVAQRTEEISVLHGQLLQSQKLEAVGILAGGIAHEFNNVLATMTGSAYLIQKKLSSDSPIMKYADQIVSSIAKASSLSQGLLSFSRKQTFSLKPIYLNEAIARIAGILGNLIGEHIELKLLLAENDATVVADANQIEQVLVNLTTNARDAMPDGGMLTIETQVMEIGEEFIKEHGYGIPGSYILLTVSDTGTGMTEDVRGRIFQPFFTTKTVGQGSGLGLAVSYGIIKQHKGFIDVESFDGGGTTFKVYLPIADEEAPAQEQSRETLKVKHGGETILLAEDDPDARVIMKELLEMTGYTVLLAADGEEAVKLFTANVQRVDLVLADVRMPKKDGRVVYEEIHRISPVTKFLFTSGYTADVIDSHGIRELGLEFISKAARSDELLVKVRDVLDAQAPRSGIVLTGKNPEN